MVSTSLKGKVTKLHFFKESNFCNGSYSLYGLDQRQTTF